MSGTQVYNPFKEEIEGTDPNQPDMGAGTDQGLTTTGGQTGGAGGGPISTSSPGSKRQGSGRFTNLNKYLDANQGSGQRMATGIAQGAQRKADVVESKAQDQASKVREGIQAEKTRLGGYGNDETPGFYQQLQTAGGAQQILDDEEQAQQFGQLARGETALPELQEQATQAYGAYQGGANALGKMSQAAGTEEGRFGLLRDTFATPTYGLGQRRLDQLFLQAGGRDTLSGLQQNLAGQQQEAQTRAEGVQSEFNTGLEGIKTDAETYAENLQNFLQYGSDVEGLEDDLTQMGYQDVGKYLQDTLGQYNEDQIAAYEAFEDAAETGVYTPEQLAALGVKSGQSLYGNVDNLSDYLNPAQVASLSQVASPEEIQRYQALTQLSGLAGLEGPEGGLLNLDIEQAGTAPELLNIDTERLQEDITSGQKAFEKTFTPEAERYQTWKQLSEINPLVSEWQNNPITGGTGGGGYVDVTNPELIAAIRENLSFFDPTTQEQLKTFIDPTGNVIGPPDTSLDTVRKIISSGFSDSQQSLYDYMDQYGAGNVVGKDQLTNEQRFQRLLDQYANPVKR